MKPKNGDCILRKNKRLFSCGRDLERVISIDNNYTMEDPGLYRTQCGPKRQDSSNNFP